MPDRPARPPKPANHVEVSPEMLTTLAIGPIYPPGNRAGWATARTSRGWCCAFVEAPTSLRVVS